jgi:hypothetical protein
LKDEIAINSLAPVAHKTAPGGLSPGFLALLFFFVRCFCEADGGHGREILPIWKHNSSWPTLPEVHRYA